MESSEGRRLGRRTFAAGGWWEAGSKPPADVAAKIKNPAVWASDADSARADQAEALAESAVPQMVKNVVVDGVTWGPNNPPPVDIARRIKNPAVWGGRIPTFDQPAPAPAPAPALGAGQGGAGQGGGSKDEGLDDEDPDDDPEEPDPGELQPGSDEPAGPDPANDGPTEPEPAPKGPPARRAARR